MEEGLIEIAGRRSAGRGYPAPEFRIRPSGGFALGVNVDQDQITVVLVDFAGILCGRIHHNIRFPSVDVALEIVKNAVVDLYRQTPEARQKTYGMGLAVPGCITLEGELATPPAGMIAWQGLPLQDLFAAASGYPVWVENNANSAAVGESFYGVGQKHLNFLHIVLGTGVGCGLILNGLLYRGSLGFAGELGLYPMTPLESYGDNKIYRNLSESISFNSIFERLKAQNEIGQDIKTINDLVASNHPEIEIWLEHTTALLLTPVSVVQSLLDPDAIVISGDVSLGLIERLVGRLNDTVATWQGGQLMVPKFLTAKVGSDGAALGAATLPFYHALSVRPEGLLKNAGPPKPLFAGAV